MPRSYSLEPSDTQLQLQKILQKIVNYQKALPDDRPVFLDELIQSGILSSQDQQTLKLHNVTFHPHRMSDSFMGDMFEFVNGDGSAALLGPQSEGSTGAFVSLKALPTVVQDFMNSEKIDSSKFVYLSLSSQDHLGINRSAFAFLFKTDCYRSRRAQLLAAGVGLGLLVLQDDDTSFGWSLNFQAPSDGIRATKAIVELLQQGCGISEETTLQYTISSR
jgi:hypothetical protein